jgi:hypothetical protein
LLRRVGLAAVSLLVTVGTVYVGLRWDDPVASPNARLTPGRSASPSSPATPMSTLDLSDLPIARAPFCDRLDQGDVADALDAPVSSSSEYGSGDRVELASGLRDVSHEYDCTYDAATGAQARVWVFAEPVTPEAARTIARDARREKGCSLLPRAPTYGTPSVASLCRTSRPVTRAVTLRGLFGDAWLTCRLSTPGTAASSPTVARAQQWCVRVATTLGARP